MPASQFLLDRIWSFALSLLLLRAVECVEVVGKEVPQLEKVGLAVVHIERLELGGRSFGFGANACR